MKRIAFLIDYFYTATFQQEAVNGLIAALADTDTELFVFLGGTFDKDPYDPFVASRNAIYELITRDMFDGIIVCNSVGNNIPAEEMIRHMAAFKDFPIAFYGNGPPGFPNAAVDNRTAMAGLVRHFIRDHGYRRIAFITGPRGNMEAEDRFTAYREQLKEAGLPFDPALVFQGDFNVGAGVEAVRALLDERRVRFQALIASNDFMALGAKHELEKRGVFIPGDVALAGFDDSMDASCIIPSLTTVRQPYRAIAAAALDILRESAAGLPAPPSRSVPGAIVIRQSCGCYSKNAIDDKTADAKSGERDPAAYYARHRDEFISRLESILTPAGETSPRDEIEFFLDAAAAELSHETSLPAFVPVQKLMSYCIAHRVSVEKVQDAISLIRNLFSPVMKEREVQERAENFFQKARLAVSEVQDVQKNQNLLLSLKQTDQLSEVSQALFSTVESTDLADVIHRTFPLFNINNFLFAEFTNPEKDAGQARLVALIRDGQARPEAEHAVFPSRRLFPDGVPGFGIRVHFVLPVVYQEKKLGFVIYEKIEGLKPLYPTLSGGFAGSFYFEKIEGLPPLYLSLTREIAKSHYINRLISMRKAAEEMLLTLTANLEFRNQELEDFTHIASHDLKEPLRKIVFFSEKLENSLPGGTAPQSADYLHRMRQSALRMNDLIEGLLAYSRISTNKQPVRRVDLTAVIAEAIQDLEARIDETKGKVEVGEMPSLSANPLLMRELFQNLIGNALKYHRPGEPPVIVIRSQKQGKVLEITVADNGIGFDPRYVGRIFGIFQRLVGKSEYEGTGVGLAICKKIVEKHNGTISAHGEPGRGATFVIRLPAEDGDA